MTIVVLGFREGLVEAAADFGDVLVIADHQKPALGEYPHLIVDDVASINAVTEALQRMKSLVIDAVVTAHEQGVLTCHALRERFQLPAGVGRATASRFRDKKIQKDALAISTPRARCEKVDISLSEYSDISALLGEKFVLKPVDGFGSVSTRIISSPEDFSMFRSEFGGPDSPRFLAESFVEGEEWHVDGVWHAGSFTWSAVSTYTNSPIAWVNGLAIGGAPLAGAYEPEERFATEFVANALRQLETPDAVVHVEIFRHPDGRFIFSEAAIRVAGALVPEVLELTFGQNLYRAEVELALGLTPKVTARASPTGVFGYTYLLRTDHSAKNEAELFEMYDVVSGEYPPAAQGRIGAYGRWGFAILRGDSHWHVMRGLRELALAAEGGRP